MSKLQPLDITRFIEFGNLERKVDVPTYDIVDLDIPGFPPLTIPPCICSEIGRFKRIMIPNNSKRYVFEIINSKGKILYSESLNNFKKKGKGYKIHNSSLKLKPVKNVTIRLIGRNKKGKAKIDIEIKNINLVK